MGYLFWPQCVEYTARRAAAATGLPVIVTENGIGTDDDAQRVRYLTGALEGVRHLLDEGVDVRGYFQWSLLDNFEWALGLRAEVRDRRRGPDDLRAHAQALRALVRRGDR